MGTEPSDWAKHKAQAITSGVPFWSTRALREKVERNIAIELDAAAQRAASVRVVRTIETRSGVFVTCGQSVGLGPGQSLAVIESAEAAAGEGER